MRLRGVVEEGEGEKGRKREEGERGRRERREGRRSGGERLRERGTELGGSRGTQSMFSKLGCACPAPVVSARRSILVRLQERSSARGRA